MKRCYILIILLSLSLASRAQKLDYQVQDLNYNWINLEEYKGEKLTVIDFWATWCKPCIKALPKINELNEAFNKRGVRFIGVNVDDPRNQSKIQPFTSSLSIDYLIVLDPDQEIQYDLNVSVMPTLIILDENQNEVFRHEGFHQGDEKIIKQKLEALL